MQDRFKFRAYNIITKEFINKIDRIGDYSDMEDDDGNNFAFRGYKEFHTTIYAAQPKSDWIIMQCTGLKDKNGKLIYEGDILADAEHKYIVEWSLHDGYFIRKPWLCDVFSYRIDNETTKNTKIIGNIYENPELLESEEE